MADRTIRVGLVGSGSALVRAMEVLQRAANVEIVVVADPGGTSEGTRRARDLGIRLAAKPMDVFQAGGEVILELNGDHRQYERLLAVKPPRAEVLTSHGTRMLIDLLSRPGGESGEDEAIHVLIVVASNRQDLVECFTQGFAGVPHVEVMRERRYLERRLRPRAQASERRQAERRSQPAIDAALRSRGFVLVRRRTGRAPK